MDKLEWPRRMASLMLADDGADGGGSREDSDADIDEDTSSDATDGGDDGSSDEEFDADRALAKIRKLNSENKNLREREKKAKEAAEAGGDKDKTIADLSSQVTRLKFAAKHGLPEEVINVLQGKDEAEMLAHAERLLSAFAKTERKNPDLGSSRGGGSDPTRNEDPDTNSILDAIPRL